MSLRFRLTILYSALTGGILLIFGVLVFFLVNVLLITQIDTTIVQTYSDLIKSWRVGPNGSITPGVMNELNLTANISYQVWDQRGRLSFSSPNLGHFSQPLDPVGYQSNTSRYRDSHPSWGHLRVLTVPLVAGGRPIGTLQVAVSLDVVDLTRRALLEIIAIIAATSMALAAAASWFAIGQALYPFSVVTETALQISRADDLSRRIPNPGSTRDETGRFIEAFNDTLERLEQIFTSQQRFLADVSHELRTPLTVIKGNVDLMRRIKQLDEESLDTIEDEADRLTRLVGNLLLEAQAASGKLPLYFAPVELDTLLLEVFKEMRVLARERVNIRLTEIDQIMVTGDRDRLKQVLINLISNAIKYTPKGGEVFLSLGKVGDNARLIVRDTGQGISNEDLPHIFERFFRAEKSRTRSKTSGVGLGLSIAHWIVDHHGGHIEVASEENKGATFCIYLPITKTAETPLRIDPQA
jgi:two-component system, OmpR family, sensor kinase